MLLGRRLFSAESRRSINRTQLISMMKSKDNDPVLLVDVRQPEEFRAGTIPRAVNVPLDKLHMELDSLDQQNTYILFCQAGVRSARAQQLMHMAGYQHVFNYEGSYADWESSRQQD